MFRRIVIAILGLMLVVLLVFTGLQDRTVLVIEEQSSGLQHELYPLDDQFVLSYIHSVLLTPVDEHFIITEDNALILQKTVYESFGVGLPYEQINDADFEIIDGKFILYLERQFESLNMIISPIPKHSITVNGETFQFNEMLEIKDQSIKIYIIEKKVFKIGNYSVAL
ncbi:MAG: DUF1850 domain-containing protein [Bacillota bacterium]|nr:DUF1850 domain-containing protein [Bacillota bacterium]